MALEKVFLILIGIVVVILVSSLIFSYRGIIIDFLSNFFIREEIENKCTTKFSISSNIDKICSYCLELGRKLKQSCYCYVVYNETLSSYNNCEMECNLIDNKIWLIYYDVSQDKVLIKC